MKKLHITRRSVRPASLSGRSAALASALFLFMPLGGVTALSSSCNQRRLHAIAAAKAGTLPIKSEDASMQSDAAENLGTLSESESAVVPLQGISGLARWPDRSGTVADRAIAISDKSYALALFDLAASAAGRRTEFRDVKPVLQAFLQRLPAGSAAPLDKNSQWEAVATDGAGAVFLLGEPTQTLTVLSSDLGAVTHLIDLAIPPSHSLAAAWNADDNSRGEGLVLLSNGHVLVVKEKKPSVFIEFGPAGEAPQGFNATTRLQPGDAFRLPLAKRATFVPLQAWPLAKESADALRDVSEITVGTDGVLYLLSDKSASLAKLTPTLAIDQAEARIESVWKFPTQVVQPEGLLMLEGGVPWVAIDAKSENGPNLFRFDPLP